MKTPLAILLAAACSLASLTAAPTPAAKSVSQLAGELRREVAIAQAETAEAKKNVATLKSDITNSHSQLLKEISEKEAAQAKVKDLEAKLKRKQFGAGVLGFFLAVVLLVAAGMFFNRRQETVIVATPPPDTGSGPGEPAATAGPSPAERAAEDATRAQAFERTEVRLKLSPRKKSRTARRSVPTSK